METIETTRLILRQWKEEDVNDLHAYGISPVVGPMAGWKPHESLEESRDLLHMFMAANETWALELKENHKMIGSIGLHKSKKANINYDCELGYVLSEEYWGQGLMPEEAKAVIDYAFRVLKIDVLLTSHFPFNKQSKRVIEKMGFQYMTHLTGSWPRYDGVDLDEEVYVMYSDSYQKAHPYNSAVKFFEGWQETMLYSCFQGHMGKLLVNDEENITAAQVELGDFCFFAGTPDEEFAKTASVPIIVPREDGWNEVFEKVFGEKIVKETRYAIKKEPNVFDKDYLKKLAQTLPENYCIEEITGKMYDALAQEEWSKYFCCQFANGGDFDKRGMGVVALYNGKPVAGASSYSIYNEGIEIEIDTKEEYRRLGLATACAAQLMLNCFAKGLYPSWDAIDMRSVSLAQKLGYHLDQPYTVFYKIMD